MTPAPADPAPARLRALALAGRADRLGWIARSVVDGAAGGAHRSRFRGEGAEFAEHKPYAPGDDPRQIDWRALARSDRLVVRRAEGQRALAAELLLDVSRSMEFGTVEPEVAAGPDVPATKSEAAAMAAVVLGYALLRQGDAVTVTRVGAEPVPGPRRTGEAQLAALCADVAAGLPAEEDTAALSRAVADARSRLRGRGLLLVLSDALEADDRWLAALGAARAQGHDVALIHLLDPAERDFPYRDPARFVDPEGGDEVRAHPARVARRYRALFAAHVEGLVRRLQGADVLVRTVETGQPIRLALGPLFGRGGAAGGGR